jgi:hypothetical protein
MPRRPTHETIPADFRKFALAHSIRHTRARYGIGYPMFQRWCVETGIDQKIAVRLEKRPERMPKSPAPAEFRAFALAHKIRDSLTRFNISHRTFARWAAETGIADAIAARPKNPHPPKVVPADFAENATRSNAELRAMYPGNSETTIARWRKAVGVVVRPVKSEEPAPADFKATVSQMYVSQACRHYERSDAVVRRWARETGASFKAWNGWNHTHAAPIVDHRPADLAAKAQSHLQRIGPVYRRGDQFSVFGRLMPAGEMSEFAARKGFAADDWRRL